MGHEHLQRERPKDEETGDRRQDEQRARAHPRILTREGALRSIGARFDRMAGSEAHVRSDGRARSSPRLPPGSLVASTSMTTAVAPPATAEPEPVARRAWPLDAVAAVALLAAAAALRSRPL